MSALSPLTVDVIAQSSAMREVVARIAEASSASRGVLITGEVGSGRGYVARLIHEQSRKSGPFVSVRCNFLEPSRADGEIFGRTDSRGQTDQTSRIQNHYERIWPGSLIHEAMNGTMCLSHVEELPERVQSRLARVFRDGEVVVGASTKSQTHGILPLALADTEYASHLRDGRVRPDLHKRLSSIGITVPPLRERREDIPALARRFVQDACERAVLPVKKVSPAAQSLLAAMPWLGNLRELRSLIETVVLKSPAEAIDLDTLLPHLKLEDATAKSPSFSLGETLRGARARFEREYINAVLAQHRGRIPDAARSLGIQRTNLYRKLRSLHLVSLHESADHRTG